MRVNGRPIEPGKTYKVAGWASVQENVKGEAIWDVVARYLRDQKVIKPRALNLPRMVNVQGNPGLA
jgi:sulfur-oxidizing protein SoxB